MIDRTNLDLRLAAHHAAMARCNTGACQEPGRAARRPFRRAVAVALAALAARLDPAAAPAPERVAPRAA